MNSGIYTITNLENGKIYIGSTNDFDRRWDEHRDSLCRGNHHNKYLQRSWNKYGEKAFEFDILEHSNDLENLHLPEQFWMDKYREEDKILYNMGKYADSALRGSTMSKEQKAKIGETLMGHLVSEESKRKRAYTVFKLLALGDGSYPALRHKKTGEVISAGIDLVALCLERGLSVTQMAKMVYRKCPSCQGWRLKESPLLSKKEKSYPALINKETGEIIPEGVNLAALCREHGWSMGSLWALVHRETCSFKGWELKDNPRPNKKNRLTENQVLWIRALVKEGILQKDVSRLLNVSKSTVSMIIHLKRWTWLLDSTHKAG